MALGDVIARLAVSLSLETAAFEKGATIAEKRMAQSQRRFEAMGKSMQGLGKTMSLAVTAPLVAIGVASVKAATESQEALGQVTAALKSMGNASGRTAGQLQALASSEMGKSLYDDDEILRKVTANLLTFGNVSGTNFDRAQQAAIDLAARLGEDLQPATIQIGKALNDPIQGLTTLRRVGIQFTQQQQDQIKAMVAAGNTAGAQGIILDELSRKFAGSAEAMRKADPMGALKLSFGEFEEQVGGKLLPLLPRITDAITGMLDAFGKLSPAMQTAVVVGGALAAVLGPVLVALGGLVQIGAPLIAGLGTLVGVIGEAAAGATTFGGVIAAWAAGLGAAVAAFAPVLLVLAAVAAAGYAIYENWDKIAPVLKDLWNTIKATIGPPLQDLVKALSQAFGELWRGPLGDAIRAATPLLLEFQSAAIKAFGSAVVAMIVVAAKGIGGALDVIAIAVRAVTALFDGTMVTVITAAMQRLYQGVKPWIDRLAALLYGIAHPVEAATSAFHTMYDKVVGHSYVPDMVDGIAAQMARLDAVMVKPAKAAASAAAQAFQQMQQDVRGLLDDLFPEIAAKNAYDSNRAKLIAVLGDSGSASARLRLADQYDQSRPQSNIAPSGSMESTPLADLNAALPSLGDAMDKLAGRAKETTVRVAKSFKDMADQTLQSLNNLTQAIKGGGFLNILSAVISLGMQLGSIGAFGKTIQGRINAVPGHAAGTMSAGAGLALVGERGPELVNFRGGERVYNNRDSMAMAGRGGVMEIRPSPLFDVYVDGKLVAAAPQIASAGGDVGVQRMQYRQTRRVG